MILTPIVFVKIMYRDLSPILDYVQTTHCKYKACYNMKEEELTMLLTWYNSARIPQCDYRSNRFTRLCLMPLFIWWNSNLLRQYMPKTYSCNIIIWIIIFSFQFCTTEFWRELKVQYIYSDVSYNIYWLKYTLSSVLHNLWYFITCDTSYLVILHNL